MKYDFWKVYQGPRGNHLSWLTKMTLKGERAEDGFSIKPRHGKRRRQVEST